MKYKEYRECLDVEIGRGIKRLIKSKINCSCNAVLLIRRCQLWAGKGAIGKMISRYYSNKLKTKYGIFVTGSKKIGKGLKLPHPNGIIIGVNEIGKNCTIYQQVTFGSKNIGDFKYNLQPNVGDNCVFFAGSKIIGNIKIANGTTVGANCVLNLDTEENSTYVGIPAHIVKKKNQS